MLKLLFPDDLLSILLCLSNIFIVFLSSTFIIFLILLFIIFIFLLFSFIFKNFPFVKFGDDFIFNVFSPSKVPVSIKHIPSGKLLSINIKSEGNTPSFTTLTISPIRKLPLSILIH